MGGNGGETGRNIGIVISRGSGGGWGIYTVYASITQDKIAPTTNPQSSVNVESIRLVISAIGCATTTLDASSFKGSGAGDSKHLTHTGSVMFVSPVVVVVEEASLYPPSASASRRRGSGVSSLTLLMLMVATFVSPALRSNFATTKVLRLPNAVVFVPIHTSRTMQTRIMLFLLAP